MSSVPYPKSCIWYVEARSGKDSDAVRSAGSAVCVWLKRESDEQPRKYLLTCSHVVRAKSADGRPAAGALLPFILCWAPGRGFVPVKDSSDWPGEADCGVWTAKVVDVYDRPKDVLSPNDLEESHDWVLLDVDQSDFQDYPSVARWESSADSGISIVGFPAGAGIWTPGTIVESLSADDFRKEVTSSTPALTALTSPEETAPGMSGGGLINPGYGFAGLHRAQSLPARQTAGISAKHIEHELNARGFITITCEPNAVQKKESEIDPDALGEFWRFVKDAGSFYSQAAYGTVIAPVLASLAGFASPFPSETLLTALAPLAAIFALMVAFQYWLHGETSKERLRQLLCWFGAAAFLLLAMYLGLFSYFVVLDEAQASREVAGFVLQPDVHILRDSQSPPLNDRQLLENLGGEPTRVWTKFSIFIVGMALAISWILMWFLMTLTVGVFLCDSWLRKREKACFLDYQVVS